LMGPTLFSVSMVTIFVKIKEGLVIYLRVLRLSYVI